MMNFQEKLAEKKVELEGSMPPEAVKIMHAATKDLVDRGFEERVIKVGSKIDDYELENQNGGKIRISDLYKDKPLVITFYRGVWCPYCNIDIEMLNEINPQLKEKGINLVTISPELPRYSRTIVKKESLTYDILWDKQNLMADSFGLKWEFQPELKELYTQFGLDMAKLNGDDSWSLPMPGRFLIDTDGVVRYAEAAADYTKRPDPDALFKAIEKL